MRPEQADQGEAALVLRGVMWSRGQKETDLARKQQTGNGAWWHFSLSFCGMKSPHPHGRVTSKPGLGLEEAVSVAEVA